MKAKLDEMKKAVKGPGKIIAFMNMIRRAMNILRGLINKDAQYTFEHPASLTEIKTLMNSLCITFWMEADDKELTSKANTINVLADSIKSRKPSKVSIDIKNVTAIETFAGNVSRKGKKVPTDPDVKAFRDEGIAAKFLSKIYVKVSPIINSFVIAMNKAVKAQSDPNTLLKESMEQLQELGNIISILENFDQAYVLLEHMLNNLEGENEMNEKNLLDLKVISESSDDEFNALLDKLIAESAKVEEEVQPEETKTEAVTLTPEQMKAVMESEDPKAALAALMAPPEPVAESAGPEKVLETMKAVLEAEDPVAALAKFMEDVNAGTIKTEVPTAASLNPPGGRTETPTSKPYDKQAVPIPGGDSETPKSKPYDAMKLSIPAGSEISASTYNDILNRLQKSYKDNAAAFESTIEILRDLRVVDLTIHEEQAALEEAAMEEALFESYLSGVYYESSDNPNKAEIRKASKAIQKRLETLWKEGEIDENKNKYRLVPSKGVRRLFGKGAGIKSKAWQTVGVFYSKTGPEAAVKHYQTVFKEELGEGLVLNAAKLKASASGLTNPHFKGLDHSKGVGSGTSNKAMGLKGEGLTSIIAFIALSIWMRGWAPAAASAWAYTFVKDAAQVGAASVVGKTVGRLIDFKRLKKAGGVAYILYIDTNKTSSETIEIDLSSSDQEDVAKTITDKTASDEESIKESAEFFAEFFKDEDEILEEGSKNPDVDNIKEEEPDAKKEKEKED